MTQNKIVVGYLGISGFAQPIRYLLSYLKADWTDKVYPSHQEYYAERDSLKLKFPNIPYLIDGDISITESSAIIRYLPKRFNRLDLLGKDLKDQTMVDTIFGVLDDVFASIRPLFMSENWKAEKEAIWEKIKNKLHILDQTVHESGWVLGYPTVVDFRLADFVRLLCSIFEEHANEIPKLRGVTEKVYSLPEIQKYRQSGVTKLLPPYLKLQLPEH